MDRKATEKIFSIYWFVILILVAGGIFTMVYVFYHYPYDIRDIEGNIMVNKVADCLSTGGKINSYIIREGTFNENLKNNFLEICDITFETEEDWDVPQYYLEVGFYDSDRLVFDFSEGNKNLISSCGAEKEIEKEKLARCVERDFYSLDDGNSYLIKILSIVRKTEKNVRQ